MHASLGDDDGHADEHDEDLPGAHRHPSSSDGCTRGNGRRGTHQDSDDELEEHDRLAVEGVPHREENEDVRAGEQDAGVERDPGEEEAYRDGGAEELGEVGCDDGDLCEGVQRVEHEPAPEEGVFGPRMQEDAAMGGEVWVTAGERTGCYGRRVMTYRGL